MFCFIHLNHYVLAPKKHNNTHTNHLPIRAGKPNLPTTKISRLCGCCINGGQAIRDPREEKNENTVVDGSHSLPHPFFFYQTESVPSNASANDQKKILNTKKK